MVARSPWWPYVAIDNVAARLQVDAAVFEFGGGGSTLWLAGRVDRLTTVEHDPGWFRELTRSIEETADFHVELRESSITGTVSSVVEPGRFFDNYVSAIESQLDDSLDLVIVDGRARVECALAAKRKIKPGGMLLLDDSDRPRYQRIHSELCDWAALTARGLKSGSTDLAQSTVWTKPASVG
ncbi:hypothetical protein BH10ACT10_BH10ACT10_01700 [soil metagenome]